MAICKAPTLQLTPTMYTEMENVISNLTKSYHIDIYKGSSITM